MKTSKWLGIQLFTIITLFLISIVVFAAPKPVDSQDITDCKEYEINISKQSQQIENLTNEIGYYKGVVEDLTNEVDYYKQMLDFYKNLYENKDANITNKELIEIKNNITIIENSISNLFQKTENIENKLTLFSFEVGMSIVGGVALIEIVLKYSRKRKKHDKEEIRKDNS